MCSQSIIPIGRAAKINPTGLLLLAIRIEKKDMQTTCSLMSTTRSVMSRLTMDGVGGAVNYK